MRGESGGGGGERGNLQPQPLRRDASDLVGSGWSGVAIVVCGAYCSYMDESSGP